MAVEQFSGKVAFITGGVSGIGLGIAKTFARAGIRLALAYRNEEHRTATAQWFAANGFEEPLFVKLDVTDRKRFAEVAEEVEAHFGKVHILVNNAGVSVFGPTDEASYADFDWIMGVNFGGVVNGLVSFIPKLKAHGEGGHVVNVASMAAFLAGPQAGIYTASKFAVRGLTECLRYNLAPYDIGVSLMCPGLTRSNAFDSALKRPEQFSDSGFGAVKEGDVAPLAQLFEAGMDPEEVGAKTLRGIAENRLFILTHPEFQEDFQEIADTLMAALPDEEAPPARLAVETQRREAAKRAMERAIDLSDLVS